jgi:hypothetical protein
LLSRLLSTRRRRPLASPPAPCRGWPASSPGRLRPGPLVLTGGGIEAPRSGVAEGHFRRKRAAPLTVEGCRRILSGPSPEPRPAGADCATIGA